MDFFEIINFLYGIEIDYLFLFLLAGGIYLVLHILQGIGLYTLSRRARLRHSWIAFLPFVNSYAIGRLAGECSFFGKKTKHAGIYYALSEVACSASYAVLLITDILLDPYIHFYDAFTYDYVGYPENLTWAYNLNAVMDYVSLVLYIIYIVFMVMVLFSFFRKYAIRHAWMFTFFSVFLPAKGAFIFAIRKNAPFDYERYMRAQREAYYRNRQQYYNGNPYDRQPYNNPYQNNGNYSNPNSSGNPGAADPFEEFSSQRNPNTDTNENDRSENDEFFR